MSRVRTLGVTLLLVLSLVATMGVATADPYDGDRADLEIDQPDYVEEDVNVERATNATIYHVHGPEQTIEFRNAEYENVTRVGVLDGPGSIERNPSTETFTFSANDSEATTAVYFDVDDGEETRYVADIRASNVEWTHVPAAEYEEVQEDAKTLESLQRDAQSAVPGQDPIETLKDGIEKEAFFKSPGDALRQDMQGTLMMLVMTNGGRVIFGSFIGITVLMLAKAYRYKNRTQKQLAELEEMQREKDEAWLQKAREILQQCDWNELFPDHIARSMRDYFGQNVWLGFKQYALMRSPTSTKGTMLQMMEQIGYIGVLEYDEHDQLVDARAVKDDRDSENIPIADGGDERRGRVEEIDLGSLEYDNAADREIIEQIPSDDLDWGVFEHEIDTEKVSFPIDNREVSNSELLEALDPEFPGDFEDREQLSRVLSESMQFVANHPYTDDDGNVRREKDLLSFMMEMDTILHDEADFPAAYMMQKELLYVAEHMDKGDRLDQRIDSLSLDGVSSNQIDRESGGVTS